jgi:hypothetical protein
MAGVAREEVMTNSLQRHLDEAAPNTSSSIYRHRSPHYHYRLGR